MFKSFTASDKKGSAGPEGRKRGLAVFAALAAPDSGSGVPGTVQRAVKLMLAGAAASTVYLVFGVIVTAGQRNSLINALITSNNAEPKSKQLTLSQIHTLATFYIVETLIIGLIAIALWLWMARMNSGGRNWARITASVLFLLWTYYTYVSIGQTRGAASLIISTVIVLVIWLIGLASLFLLWRPPSTAFFKGRAAAPAAPPPVKPQVKKKAK